MSFRRYLFYVLILYKMTLFGLEKIKPTRTQLLCLPFSFPPLQKTLISLIHKPLSSSSSQTLLYSHIDLLLSHFLSYDDALDNTATQEIFWLSCIAGKTKFSHQYGSVAEGYAWRTNQNDSRLWILLFAPACIFLPSRFFAFYFSYLILL